MTQITFNDHAFEMPQSWEECSDQQAIAIAGFAMLDSAVSRFLAFKALCPDAVKPLVHSLTPEQAAEVIWRMDWVYDTFPTKAIHWEPAKPKGWQFWKPVPEAIYMPAGAGDQMVLLEFYWAEQLFEAAPKTDAALARFVAVLCRPQKRHYDPTAHDFDGERRHRFNPNLLEIQAEHLLRHVPARYLCYVFLWFIGLKHTLAGRYAPLFRKVERPDDPEEQEPTPKIPRFGWLGVIFDLAEEGIFGNEEQTQYAYMHNVFTYLCRKYYQAHP